MNLADLSFHTTKSLHTNTEYYWENSQISFWKSTFINSERKPINPEKKSISLIQSNRRHVYIKV